MLASRKKQEGSSKNKRELSLFLNEAAKRGREGRQVKGDGIGGKGRRGGPKGGKVKGRERKGGKGKEG